MSSRVLKNAAQMCSCLHGGASCHRAKSVIEWLEDCRVDFIGDWPSNSPDFHPVKNLWSIIKRRLQGRDTSTIAKLEAACREEWNNLGLEMIHKLAESVPSRIQECIKRKGGPIDF